MNKPIQILKSDPAFIHLFTLIKEKYRSLGHIGGKVSVENFTLDELESISGLIGMPVETILRKKGLTLSQIEESLEKTIFQGFSLLELVEEVLEETILTKIEEKEIKESKEQAFLSQLKDKMSGTLWWCNRISEKNADSRFIWNAYKEDADLIEKFETIYRAYMSLPQENTFERIPLFAQRITGNPHSFDPNTLLGKMLIHCLFTAYRMNNPGFPFPKTMEELNELYGNFNLMRDDLWSFVTCRGLLAENEEGIHPVWESATNTGSVLNVPMKELLKVKVVWPQKGNEVWIVENSSVCSTIIDEVPDAPIICTHGQFRTASWLLIHLLVQSNTIINYSGDLDPEGIAMAERLKTRYPNHVVFWRMDKLSYEKIISDEDISSRITKLDSIKSLELKELVEALRSVQKAGYQEGLIDVLVQDVKGKLFKH